MPGKNRDQKPQEETKGWAFWKTCDPGSGASLEGGQKNPSWIIGASGFPSISCARKSLTVSGEQKV